MARSDGPGSGAAFFDEPPTSLHAAFVWRPRMVAADGVQYEIRGERALEFRLRPSGLGLGVSGWGLTSNGRLGKLPGPMFQTLRPVREPHPHHPHHLADTVAPQNPSLVIHRSLRSPADSPMIAPRFAACRPGASNSKQYI